MPTGRVLHVLSQRPGLTGSGVTLHALVRQAARAGWEQRAVCGVPADDPRPRVGDLPPDAVAPLLFAPDSGPPSRAPDVEFPVPGMSDVMPYRSTRFSAMEPGQVEAYRVAWIDLLARVRDAFQPDVVHAHHAWIVSSLLRDVFPHTPVVMHGHGTALRQLRSCPGLAASVRAGCGRNDAIVVLHELHRQEYAREYGLDPTRCHVVGAGYDAAVFHARGRVDDAGPTLLFAGKLSRAKGLDCLLDAFDIVRGESPSAVLHVAGSGSGAEADELRRRVEETPGVAWHGKLEQPDLAARMRETKVFVLPSFFEGLGLVLVEALACGCRLVSNDLPGLAPVVEVAGDALARVPMPRLVGADTPDPADRPAYVERLARTLRTALDRAPSGRDSGEAVDGIDPRLAPFTWEAVFERVETVWLDVMRRRRAEVGAS